MKKLLCSVSILLSLSTTFAQQRLVLTESFSQASCGPCASQNPALEALMVANSTKVVAVKYQVSWPGTDPMNAQNPTEIDARVDYYGISGVPDRVLDGTNMDVTQSAINTRYSVASPVDMSVSHVMNSSTNTIDITVTITAPQIWNPTNTVMQLAMIERTISFANAPGSNGETEFHNVMRKMVPNVSGSPIVASNFSSANGTQTFTFTGVAIPSYIYDLNEIGFVAWAQNNTTKEVYQAAYSAPIPLPNYGVVSSLSTPGYSCASELTGAVAVLENTGANEITSATVNYRIDNNAVETAQFTGSLAVGATTNFPIPTTACSSGSHTLAVYLTNINGSGSTTPIGQKSASFATISVTPSTGNFTQNFSASAFPYANYYVTSPQGKNWTRVTTNTGSLKYDTYNYAAGSMGEVYLSPINLSSISIPELSFSLANRQYSDAENDMLEVEISTDCGVNWTNVYSKSGAELSNDPGIFVTTSYTPAAADWRIENVNIASFATATSALIKFKATSDYGNNIYVDNINIGSASVEKLSQSRFNVYPNPATDLVNVSFDGNNSDYIVSLLDLQGRVIYTQQMSNLNGSQMVSISTANIAKGSYVLSFSENELTTTKNVVIK